MFIYGFYDKVKERFDACTLAYTDRDAIRRHLIMNNGQKPLCDVEIYLVATANEENGEIHHVEHRLVDKSIYCLPEGKEEELAEFNPDREVKE